VKRRTLAALLHPFGKTRSERKRRAVLLLLAAGLFSSSTAGAEAADAAGEPRPPLLRISATAWLASLEGHLQTPSGGRVGTTSPGRPRLEEIGLGGLQVLPTVDVQLRIARTHELHLAYVHIDLRGSAVLEDPLVSQGVLFPAGSPVESGLELPLLRLGYRAHWLRLNPGRWHIAPEVGIAGFDFAYILNNTLNNTLDPPSAVASVDRRYAVLFPYLGFLAERPLLDRLDFEGEVFGSAGINGTSYAELDLRLVYALLRRRHASVSGMLGLRGLWLYRRDGQKPVPNEIDVRVGSFSSDPWAGFYVGLRLEF